MAVQLETVGKFERLIEIAAFGNADGNRLLVVEWGDSVTSSPSRIESIWQLWETGETGSASKIWERRCFIPPTTRIGFCVRSNAMYAVLESNTIDALYILELRLDLQVREITTPALIPVNPTEPAELLIDKIWSTHSGIVAPANSLFDPAISLISPGRFLVAACSADLTTHLFVVAESGQNSEIDAIVPSARPHISMNPAKNILLYQKPGIDWSPYYFSLARKIPSALMPINFSVLENELKPGEPRELCTGQVIGQCFIYAAYEAGENRMVFAGVGNTSFRPILQVCVSTDAGSLWREVASVQLPAIPHRMAVAAHGFEAIVGLVFGGSDLKAIRFSID